MKEQKVGLTATNWILSILGILILSSFIILPPVFRTYLKEKVEEAPKLEIKIGTTTCQNENLVNADYKGSETLTFIHRNQKIHKFTRSTLHTYLEPLVYQEERLVYERNVTAFSIINGYEYEVTPEENTLSIQIREEYNLTTFQPTTITIPGEENPTTITTNYHLNQSITEIKNELITNGYICSDNE